MLNTNNKKPIKIAIMEASSQNRAILEFFFSNSGKSVFKESSLEDSSAVIIDYDFPGAKASWEQIYNNSQKPGIILSISEVEIPGAIWIAKPLTTQALIEAGHKIKEIIENKVPMATPAEPKQAAETITITRHNEPELEPDKALPESESAESKPLDTESPVDDTADDDLFSMETLSNIDAIPQVSLNDVAETETEKEGQLTPVTDDELDISTVTISDDASARLDFSELEPAEPVLAESSAAMQASSVKNVDHTSTTQINHAIPSVSDFAGNTNFLELDDNTFDENTAENNISNSDHQTKKGTDDATEIAVPASDTSETPEQDIDDEEIDALLESLISGGKAKQLDAQVDKITTDYLVDNMPADDTASNNHSNTGTTPLEPNKEPLLETDLFDFDAISTDLTHTEPSQSKENIEVKDDLASLSTSELSATVEKTDIEETTAVTDKTPVEDTDLFDLEIDSLTTQDDKPHHENVDEAHMFSGDLESSDLIIEENSSMIFEDLKDTPQESDDLILDDILVSTESIVTETVETDLDNDFQELDPAGLSSETPAEKTLTAEEELQALLEEIRKEAESAQTPGSISASSQLQDDQPSARPNHIPTAAEERWALTCGVNEKIATAKDVDRIAYTLSNHMLSTLLDTLVQSEHTQKVMRLKFKGHIIVVDHANDFIYCDHSIYTNQYAELCHNPIDAENIKVHELDSSEIRLYRKKAEEEPEHAHSIESFIWTTSLLTSRGRLLKYTDINKKVGLKYWPNLTRLELIPHAMQIAAVFYKHPGSLLEVSRWLKIEQRYVFAFYNAVLALKYIELDGNKLRSSSLDMEATSNTKRRGFFSRLLKRIKS